MQTINNRGLSPTFANIPTPYITRTGDVIRFSRHRTSEGSVANPDHVTSSDVTPSHTGGSIVKPDHVVSTDVTPSHIGESIYRCGRRYYVSKYLVCNVNSKSAQSTIFLYITQVGKFSFSCIVNICQLKKK